MKLRRAVELLKIEKKCIERAAMPFGCDRKCEDCDLVQDDRELLAAYDTAIRYLEDDDDGK